MGPFHEKESKRSCCLFEKRDAGLQRPTKATTLQTTLEVCKRGLATRMRSVDCF